MCPLCIISAIVLGTSAASAGGLNWLKAKFGGSQEHGSDEVCRLFPPEGSMANRPAAPVKVTREP
jgi:hypothetical protein